MPGHVKRGGAGDPDPDPAPYLFISYEEKQKGGGHTSHNKYQNRIPSKGILLVFLLSRAL
jgi:hypothetical protein